MKKYLIVRFSSLGDIVLTSVVTQQLKQQYPGSEITFLTKTKYHSLARLLPGVSRVASIGQKSGFLSQIFQLSRDRFDCVIDLHSNWRSFWVRKLIPAESSTKYNSRRFRRIRMVKFPQVTNGCLSTSDAYLQSLTPLAITATGLKPLLVLNPEDHRQAEAFLTTQGFTSDSPFIGIAPGARWETKRWHKERFTDIAKKLQRTHQSRLLLFGSLDESGLLEYLAKQVEGSVIARGLSYNQLAALISKCRCVISNDSGLMHISAALNVPTVAIFGPTHPKLGFAPQGDHTVVLTTNQPCSPCSLHGKKRCHQPSRHCMDNIAVEMVADSALKLMERFKPSLAANEK
jgi:heptosyltransferase-2